MEWCAVCGDHPARHGERCQECWENSEDGLRQRAEAAEREVARLREVLIRLAAGARGFAKVADEGTLERYNFSKLAEVAETALSGEE